MEADILMESRPDRKEYWATAEQPFHFTGSGLDNVYLAGIRYFVDTDGHVSAEIPAVKELMQLIAYDIVTESRELGGNEIRFLRKRLGKKATEYCAYLGVTAETLSRFENNKQPISAQAQKLARLSYCILSEDPHLRECGNSILQTIVEEIAERTDKVRHVLQMTANQEWRALQAA